MCQPISVQDKFVDKNKEISLQKVNIKQPTSSHGERLKKRTVSWQESRSFMAGNSKFGLRKLESPQKAQIKNELRAVSAALNHRHTGK